MSLIDNSYEDLAQATKALKTILEADEAVVEQLPPVERLMVKQIRQQVSGGGASHD